MDRAVAFSDFLSKMKVAYPKARLNSRTVLERELVAHFWSDTPIEQGDVRVHTFVVCSVALTFQPALDQASF